MNPILTKPTEIKSGTETSGVTYSLKSFENFLGKHNQAMDLETKPANDINLQLPVYSKKELAFPNETKPIKLLRYSYNPKITPDMTKDQAGTIVNDWKFVQLAWNEKLIAQMIRTQSYLPAELKEGKRLKKNVQGVYSIILDFDQGVPLLSEFLNQVENFRFACVVHTTVNHRKDKTDSTTQQPNPGSAKDKFRAIIPLSKPISEDEYNSCKSFFLKKFPTIDKTSFQGSRYFLVNPKAEVFFHDTYNDSEGTVIEAEFLDPVKEKIFSEKRPVGRPKLSDNQVDVMEADFSIEMTIILSDGKERKVSELTEKTPILCPFCDPKNRQNPEKHNAFVSINNAGHYYIYCSSEDKTYWSHFSELDRTKCRIFFNENTGCPCQIIDDEDSRQGYSATTRNDDWANLCFHNKINPKTRTFLPRCRIIFDPSWPSGLNDGYFNLFQESKYLREHDTTQPPLDGDEVLSRMEINTPVIHELMMNVFGEAEFLKRFLNWNSSILKERIKLDTAWLITSKETGIGKGLMFDRILQPIYGKRQSSLVSARRMANKFNSEDQMLWLKVFDEVHLIGNPQQESLRTEYLKYTITSRELTIEGKGVNAYQTPNHMNIMAYANPAFSLKIDADDRRWNVIRNDKAVKTSKLSFYKCIEDIKSKVDAELADFANLLLRYEINLELANEAMDTEAKENVQKNSKDEYEEFATALVNKDVSFFNLNEIYPWPGSDGINYHLSDVGELVEKSIKGGYIPAQQMKRICDFIFKENYTRILKQLKIYGITKITKNMGGEKRETVYLVK